MLDRSSAVKVQCQIKDLQKMSSEFLSRKFDISRLNDPRVVLNFEDQLKKNWQHLNNLKVHGLDLI